jgi:predicted MFS family arabinose efflux permease
MDDNTSVVHQQNKVSKLFLPALTISRMAAGTRALLTGLLLIEIGQTYGISVGLTNQIKTFNSLTAIFAALAMGFLSLRIRHKTLLIAGLTLSAICAIGSSFAPSFTLLIIIYSIGGLAGNTIFPMTNSILGTNVSSSDRPKALGWMFAGGAALYVVGYPIVNYIGDWRNAFLLFSLPFVLVALFLSLTGIRSDELASSKVDIMAGYKGILASKSALACLISTGLGLGVWQIILSLSSSFLRQKIGMSRGDAVYAIMAMALVFMSGSLIARKIIPKYGRKNTVVVSNILLAFGLILFTASFNLVMALGVGIITCFIAGVRTNATMSLNLEQLPELRGPMMSMSAAFGSTGNVLSLSLSGFLLIKYGWGVMGSVIGVFGLIAGVLVFFYAKE